MKLFNFINRIKILLIFVVTSAAQVIITEPVRCQVLKCNNIWYFGEYAGLDFNSGSPVALTNSSMTTFEGSASIADTNGNLMFYTDGSTVWNKVHAVMSNGSGLMGNFSSTQSAIIVQKPLSNHLFYVFTLDDFGGNNGLRYSVVDMNLAAGLGAVTNKNVPVSTPVTEKICAIRHSNGIDIWIVAHQWQNSFFNSYLLSPTGLNTTAVISNVGSPHQNSSPPNNNVIGYMKSSPDGTRIALGICDDRIYEIFDFDKTTGVLNNPVTLQNPDGVGSSSRAYAVEFSPNSRYLYLKNFYSSNVYQYDLINFNQTSIEASKILIGSITGQANYLSGAMQLGPDSKIYIIKYNETSLAAITAPNNPGTACNLVNTAVSLAGRMGDLGLPTMVSYIFLQNAISCTGCYPGSFHFMLQNTNNIQSCLWNFGVSTTLNDTSSLLNPYYTYTQPGNYTISVQINYIGGGTSSFTYNLTINPLTDLITPDSITICKGNNITLTANGNFNNYIWSNGSNASSITVSPVDSIQYFVSVTTNGCVNYDSVYVFVNPVPTAVAWPDTSICSGESVALHGSGGQQYQWNTGGLTADILVYPLTSSNYILTVTSNGCSSTDTVHVTVTLPPVPYLGNDTTICNYDTLQLSPGIFTSYQWSTGSNQPQISIGQSGIYWVRVWNANNCSATDTISIIYSNLSVPGMSFGPISGCNPLKVNFINLTQPPALNYIWDFGDGHYSTLENPEHLYTYPGVYTVILEVPGMGACNVSDTFHDIITVFKTPHASFYPKPSSTTILEPEITFFDESVFVDNYTWSFGDGHTSHLVNPVHIYTDTGYYTVRLITTALGGCADTATAQVHIRGFFTIYIPNAFTPNFDGDNDDFGPKGVGWGHYKVFSMMIFNRWGEMIYETEDPCKPWDGTKNNNGEVCMDGSYIYRIRLQPEDERLLQYTGFVVLVR